MEQSCPRRFVAEDLGQLVKYLDYTSNSQFGVCGWILSSLGGPLIRLSGQFHTGEINLQR